MRGRPARRPAPGLQTSRAIETVAGGFSRDYGRARRAGSRLLPPSYIVRGFFVPPPVDTVVLVCRVESLAVLPFHAMVYPALPRFYFAAPTFMDVQEKS